MEVQSARTHSGGDTALRKTRFGRLIGNLSLDDLPTLVNVLRGDRSIVGPRPEVPDKVDLKSEEWRKVLEVRPGLVGLGALTYLGAYNSTSVGERIKPELYYVEHQSLLLDLKIMGRAIYWLARMGHLKGRF
jgi:lipopolysaccharide/colanic/teichoic acid biosynthesis glycosyltransferase